VADLVSVFGIMSQSPLIYFGENPDGWQFWHCITYRFVIKKKKYLALDVDGFIALIKNNTGLAVSSLSNWSTVVLRAQLGYRKVVLVLLRKDHFRAKLQQSGRISLHHRKVSMFLSKNHVHYL